MAILIERFTIDFVIIINFLDFDFVCLHLTRKKIQHFPEIDKAARASCPQWFDGRNCAAILNEKLSINFFIIIHLRFRGATGAARAPKPGKAPIMAARRRCRRRLLFFKIEVRPRPCRPYRVRRRCIHVMILVSFSLISLENMVCFEGEINWKKAS